jgi:starch phosphorylase
VTADVDNEDAAHVYHLLESELVPLYYQRDARGVPIGWVERMKHAICQAGARFTARRMMQRYVREYYLPAIRGEAPAGDPPTA